MKSMILFLVLFSFSLGLLFCSESTKGNTVFTGGEWPELKKEHKPWTYWWWMGNAVDKKNLNGLLEQYQQAGLGGMHIVPIYGVKGEEDKFIDHLSPKWIEMLNHTITQADHLGMGIDMTSGTGWNFGGPQVDIEEAVTGIVHKTFTLSEGESLEEILYVIDGLDPERKNFVQALMAYSKQGDVINLTNKVDANGKLTWKAPKGKWELYAIFNSGVKNAVVERASPGGEGYMVNPFSKQGIANYLKRYDKSFSENNAKTVRAFYHDSYEYHYGSWSADYLDQFKNRRNYDLLLHLPALFGDGKSDQVSRIRYDYRKTLGELHFDYIEYWAKWSAEKGALTRNQAHGSPTDIIDVYALTDIPETEFQHPSYFGIPGLNYYIETNDIPNIPMMKFSSSAAHIAGKNLVSAESCTWLDEHFMVSLAQIKPEIDQLFIGGINHVFYHGIAYSPLDAEWPGWLFYASTNFASSNSFAYDFPYLNQYIARCQSILQAGSPDNDILLYYPNDDLWSKEKGINKRFGDLLIPTQVHYIAQWLKNTTFYNQSIQLDNAGYSHDYLSENFLLASTVENSSIVSADQRYQTIVIPRCTYMNVDALQKLIEHAKLGATIIFDKDLPEDVPGFENLDKRREQFKQSIAQLTFQEDKESGFKTAALGTGSIMIAEDVKKALKRIKVIREPLVDTGLKYIRRSFSGGNHYFISSLGNYDIDGWVTLGKPAESVIFMDPMTGKTANAATRKTANGQTQVYIQCQPGESLILRTLISPFSDDQKMVYTQSQSEGVELEGQWQVTFILGGPTIPKSYTTDELESWTEAPDKEAQRFAGTAKYALTFSKPEINADDWRLELGRVESSARVRINGKDVGALFAHPFNVRIGQYLIDGENLIEIEVTNLSANRIRDLDNRGVNWKKFYDINYASINYGQFDASEWDIMDSGLIGPVKLVPLKWIKN